MAPKRGATLGFVMKFRLLVAFALVTAFSSGASAEITERGKMVEKSRQLTRAYFNAVFDAKWDKAAGFLHENMIEPIRAHVLRVVLSKDAKGQAKIFSMLKVKDLNELRTLDARKFYVNYAKSEIGLPVRSLSKEYIETLMIIKDIRCVPETKSCKLMIRLKGIDIKKEKEFDRKTEVRTERVGKRWYIALPTTPAKAQ